MGTMQLGLGPTTITRVFLTCSLLGGAAIAGLTDTSAPFTLATPFELVDPGEAGTFATIRFDATDHELLREVYDRGSLLRLEGFPLPGGDAVDLELHTLRVFAEGAHATVVRGADQWRLAPSVALFAGHVPGEASEVFLAVSEGLLHGLIDRRSARYVISSGDPRARPAGAPGIATVADARAFTSTGLADPWCHALRAAPGAADRTGPAFAAGSAPAVRVADVIVEADDLFAALFPDDQQAIDYATTLVAFSSSIFRRDIGARLQIPDGYLTLWSSTPPWGNGPGDALPNWYTSAANPKQDFPRAAVLVLSNGFPCGTNPKSICGAAIPLSLCDNAAAYAWTSVDGFFPTPLVHQHQDNDDLLVVTHEFGHCFGALHTFEYSPPIPCVDGTGPDSGTIMSYCGFNPPIGIGVGIAGMGMRFHPEIQAIIRDFIDGVDCLVAEPFALGDYDQSGEPDLVDLSILQGFLAQGFDSAGALDAFDMDGSGALDQTDHDILAGLAPWSNLGLGLAGSLGVPQLAGSGTLVVGESVQLDLTHVPMQLPAFLIYSSLAWEAPFKGGVMVPAPDNVLPFNTFGGGITVGSLWPPGAPTGFVMTFQWWLPDPGGVAGWSASNAVSATAP